MNNMDRLLSEQEICLECGDECAAPWLCDYIRRMKDTSKAQLTKTDNEWIAFLHSKCPHKKKGEKRSCNACMYLFEKEISHG